MSHEHKELAALLPWYVNGTLAEAKRAEVDAHLAGCTDCRQDLAAERRIHAAVTAEPTVEYMPTASLRRLNARLDGAQHDAEPLPQPATPARRVRFAFTSGALAASVALVAAGLAFLAVNHYDEQRAVAGDSGAATEFFTVTSPGAPASGTVIRAVFAPATTVTELKAILDESQLRIVAGPTEAGVYSLASTSSRPVEATLAQLRQRAQVRFAEDVQPLVEPGRTP
jgi:Putative zinc-finger